LSGSTKRDIENAANLLKKQHADIKTDTFLKFLATLDLFTRYLDLQYTSKHATRSGFNVLNTLVLSGGSMSPTDISKKIFRSKNAISHVVSTLEAGDWLLRFRQMKIEEAYKFVLRLKV
jgi:hypothetical protein